MSKIIVDMCILISSKNMNPKTLSQVADRLLAKVERDRTAPHYGEDSFRRKVEESNKRAIKLPLPKGGREADYLIRNEWREVVASAGLTDKQLEIVAMRLEGRTFEEIGAFFGHSKQGAQNIFFQGAKKLAKAWMENPFRGLATVYREEVRRGHPASRKK